MEGNALVFEKIFFKRRKNRLFAFAILLLISLSVGCKKEKTDPSETHRTVTTEKSTEQAAVLPEKKQNAEIKELAKKRICSDIDLALWYVNQKPYNGSAVCYPYDANSTEYSKLNNAQKSFTMKCSPRFSR